METENEELKKEAEAHEADMEAAIQGLADTVAGIVALNERDASMTAGWKGLVKTQTVGRLDGGGSAAGNSF